MANVSGLYRRSDSSNPVFTNEFLRLDVDGDFPLMAASGTGFNGMQIRTHWVASPLTKSATSGGDEWSGPIIFKSGTTSFLPHDTVSLRFHAGKLHATFQRVGLPDRAQEFTFNSPHFHDVELEYDAEQGVDRVLDYDTHSHPNRPAGLPNETLSIDTVFQRAGFRVLRTGQDGVIPSSDSGTEGEWSNNEMHDAMQVHFSRLATLPPSQRDRARWALWTFFAGIHEDGETLGGIMFDSIGAAERQGTALFMKSFIADAPAGDPAPSAWRRRMAIWTAVHEMGHSFNLLHAWQKHLGTPWLPQPSGTSLLTFMNYPYFYEDGPNQDDNTIRFFRDFEFRFTDDELLFLRHAPDQFVIMGGDKFGENHALAQPNTAASPTLSFEIRINRQVAEFEFLEPVVVELKLKNTSKQPVLLPKQTLRMSDQMTVQVQKRWQEPHVFHPFSHQCFQSEVRVLQPGESIYESLFLSVDHEGWLISEPGYYTIQAALHLSGEDVVSNPLQIRVAPPHGRDEEYVAQDFFSEDVGRVLTFDGSRVLSKATDTLREVVGKLPKTCAAIHAQVALELPSTAPYKLLTATDSRRGARYEIRHIKTTKSECDRLTGLLGLAKTANQVAQTLGHIDYRYYSEKLGKNLTEQGRSSEAQSLCHCLYDTMKTRGAAAHVLEEISESMDSKPQPRPARPKKPRK